MAGHWPRYGLAILATLLAALLRYALPGILASVPYLAFYPAIVAAAAFGGMGPGLVATVASLLCVNLIFDTTPGWIDLTSPVVLARIAIFVIGGIGTSVIAQMQQAACARERRQTEALRQSEERLRLHWERMPIGCIHFDAAFRFAHVNPAAERIFGFPAAELVGRDAQCLVMPKAWPQVEDVLRRVAAGEMSAHSVNENVTKDGRTIVCEWYNTPLKDAQGQFTGLVSMVQDVTDREAAERALRENQEDLHRAQAVAHTGSWRLDVRRDELLWSNEIHRMFGIPPGTPLTYETFLGAVHPDDRDSVDRQWQAALRGELYNVEHRIVANGEVKWVHEKAELEFDSEGRLVGGFGTTQDITERKRLEESLRQAKSVAETANRAKSQFLANMSHELRTPLSAILGMTELALQEPISPTVRDFLGTAKESADLLLELLNELLDFSRIEAGRFELESAPFHLVQTIEQVVKTFGVRAREKGLSLTCDLPGDVPDRLVGDSLRLRQVLVNLLGNAIKFTAKGEILLRVQRESRDETLDSVVLQFSVSDTGIGIAPEDQQRIFSPFVQADASTTRHYGGSGLGLAIASSLVRLMDGRIWLTSQPGHGSTFHFTVRLGMPQDSPPVEEAARDRIAQAEALSAPPARTLQVLLAEDTPANQKLVIYLLTQRGHRVEVATNGQQAVELLQQHQFDVVIMDIQMPLMDGFQATAAIRRLPGPQARVPIIAMTAHALKGDQERCLAAGMDAYVSKPLDAEELLRTVEESLGSPSRSW